VSARAADDDVPASVLVVRFSGTFLGFVDIFLVDALATADAALVLAYGEFDFLFARHMFNQQSSQRDFSTSCQLESR
jgi:hypothetical protein